MEMKETHARIIEILRNKGPSLPINLAKDMRMNSLFISAFLSELVNEKRIRVSNLKVGGSPLYFLDGQEEQLEKFYNFLHPKEAEAFLLIKQDKILKDSEQEPAIRVALRSIRDFAIGFKNDDEIFWRYILVPESEVREILTPKPKITKTEQKRQEPKQIIIQKKPRIGKLEKTEFQNPLIISDEKPKKEKPKSEFVQKIYESLIKNFKVIEEKEYKTKEYTCIIQTNSQLGPINFLTQAKDKKTISESDLKKLLSESQKIPLPAFLLYTGELSKKAKEYSEKYFSILKTKKIL